MNFKYLPKTVEEAMAHMIEECAEVQKVLCKCLRFGIEDTNPHTNKTNKIELITEWNDLELAKIRLYNMLKRTGVDIS